ncbi:protein of unknown function [Moritella yayanosii]|uniref:Uncharacterized protein n=1 Tax=Moritella yayanosii TaxID=69539 RepID=A0A330LVH4_9GAMM|nr:protein of unknown function [Moritella yayanosii]
MQQTNLKPFNISNCVNTNYPFGMATTLFSTRQIQLRNVSKHIIEGHYYDTPRARKFNRTRHRRNINVLPRRISALVNSRW